MKRNFLLLIIMGLFCFTSRAQFSVVYNFLPLGSDIGYSPEGTLYYDGTYLYGTAGGGTDTVGVVYRIKPDGSAYSVLHNFSWTDGARPQQHNVFTSDGTYLYGMTGYGGAHDSGIVYRIKPDGSAFTDLHDFTGKDGKLPTGGLIFVGAYLYGMTELGGTSGDGVLFRIKPDGSGDTVLHNFSGPDGKEPLETLFYDGTYLYGTADGGTHGVVFRIKPDGTGDTVLHNFINTDGNGPSSTLILVGGYLYGTALHGGKYSYGVVFRIKPDGTGDTVLHNFNKTDGSGPFSSLFYDGTYLYGITIGGGSYDQGEIYRINPDGSGDTVLYSIDTTNDCTPQGGLIKIGSYFYGTGSLGGTHNGGVIFKYGDTITGINELTNANEVRVYPNPFDGKFTIESSVVSGQSSVEIYNVLGEQIAKSQWPLANSRMQIDLSDKPTGIYFYRIISEKGDFIASGKLIKE
jgi:uncharacterized repeat protein (TIGR03803 family)